MHVACAINEEEEPRGKEEREKKRKKKTQLAACFYSIFDTFFRMYSS